MGQNEFSVRLASNPAEIDFEIRKKFWKQTNPPPLFPVGSEDLGFALRPVKMFAIFSMPSLPGMVNETVFSAYTPYFACA